MPLIDQSQVTTETVVQIIGSTQTVGPNTPTVDCLDAQANILECHGTVIPTITTAGYSKNALFRKTDAAGGTSGLYTNIGTTLSCNFQTVDTAVGAPIPLSTGKIFEGVANVATEKTLGATFTGASDTTSSVSGGTPAGTNNTSAVTGTGTFVGTSAGALDLATPAFSGTGNTAAGQVITTTDNQTMTLNQCAGMWLIQATGATPPNLILSNTAVVGAPAVLTVQGSANTDAGAYKIVKNIIPTGSVTALSGTAAAQTFTGSALAGHTHTVTPTGTVTPTYT